MKPTLATFKKFIRVHDGKLFLMVKSAFDGQIDGLSWERQPQFYAVEKNESLPERRLGINGLWIVGSSSDWFEKFENEKYTGYTYSNCCGSGVVAVKKEDEVSGWNTPRPRPKKAPVIKEIPQAQILSEHHEPEKNFHYIECTCGKISAVVYTSKYGRPVSVCCRNAWSRAWKHATGRGFQSFSAAVEGYKKPEMKAIILQAERAINAKRLGGAA